MVAGSAVPPSCGDEPASQQAAGSPVVKPALPHPKTKLPFEAQVTHRVRPSLNAAVRTVQTAQHLERKLCLIREGKHARPPSEMPPTLAAGSAAAGLAATGVEAAGSAKAGLALARETRTVADASSADADGHPRLRRMRTRTDASRMNLGSTIDSPERIVP